MTNKAIILDLDDTIFQTSTIDKEVLEPFFSHLIYNLKPNFSHAAILNIINDMWTNTWDVVVRKHGIPLETMLASISVLDQMELKLNLSPYPDYTFIRTIECPKFLVTTSITSIQEKKIAALKIENDFTKIVINDPFKGPGSKVDVFRQLVMEYNLIPGNTIVVGDNSDSEIKAGNELNMVTVQILRAHVIKGDNARYYIKSFSELEAILGI